MHNKRYIYSHNKLVSWVVANCERCGRFLRKRDFKYCASCKDIVKNEQSIQAAKNRRVEINIYQKERRHRLGLNRSYRN